MWQQSIRWLDIIINSMEIYIYLHQLYIYLLLCTSLLCPWNSPGRNIGVGCHFLLQGIFPTQRSNPGLLHCRHILYHLSQLSKLQEIMEDWGAWRAAVHGVIKSWTWLSNWTTTIMNCPSLILPDSCRFLKDGTVSNSIHLVWSKHYSRDFPGG